MLSHPTPRCSDGFLAAASASLRLMAGFILGSLTPEVRADHPPSEKSANPAAFAWTVATPESHGFSRPKLDALRDELASRRTKIFLLIRDDRIIYEWYAPGFSADRPHYTASMAKAVIGGLAFATAMNYVPLALDEPAARYLPTWRDNPAKAKITLRQLGSHTSGLADAEGPNRDAIPWENAFWKRQPVPNDPFTLSRDVTPLLSAPGAEFHYSNPGIALFTWATTAALAKHSEKDIRSLLRERIMQPLGIGEKEWSCGYEQTFSVDGLPLVGSWGGAAFTGRSAARIGRLLLRGGNWEGHQLLSEDSVRQTTADSGLPGAVNCGWWTNAHQRVPEMPSDAYWAAGAGGQTLLIVPSLHLILVRNGDRLSDEQNDDALARYVFAPLMAAQLPR